MFKKVRLSYKIFIGFASVLVLTIALASLAMWNMKRIERLSNKLHHEYVPEVTIAHYMEAFVLSAMIEMRGYGLSPDESYLVAGNKNLQEVKKYLEEGARLSSRDPDLVTLKKNVELAEAKVKDYEQTVGLTVAGNEKIAKIRKAMDEAGARFLKSANEYQDGQKAQMKREIGDSLPRKAFGSVWAKCRR